MANNEYVVEYAKTGRSTCKHKPCRKTIAQGEVRVGKVVDSYFHEGKQIDWFHLTCIFDHLSKARKTTKVISDVSDLHGIEALKDVDQQHITELIDQFVQRRSTKDDFTPKVKHKIKDSNDRNKKDERVTVSPTRECATVRPSDRKEGDSDGDDNNTAISPRIAALRNADGQAATELAPKGRSDEHASGEGQVSETLRGSEEHSDETLDATLRRCLVEPWYTYLARLISQLENASTVLRTHGAYLFDALNVVSPQHCRLIVIGPPADPHARSGSLFACCGTGHFDEVSSASACVLRAMLPADSDAETVLKGDVCLWFSRIAQREGVLWLPVSWRVIADDALATFWPPILLKVLKIVMEYKMSQAATRGSATSPRGLVVLLLGALSINKIQPILLRYYSRVVNAFPLRIVSAPDPPHPTFVDLSTNPFVAVSHALKEVNQPPINWLLTANLDPRRDYGVYLQYTPSDRQDEETVHVSLVEVPFDQPLVLGRGSLLGIDDKALSRRQAIVVARHTAGAEPSPWAEPTLHLTPHGAAPMYVIRQRGVASASGEPPRESDFEPLAAGVTHTLAVGDYFTLCGQRYGYTVVLRPVAAAVSTASSAASSAAVAASANTNDPPETLRLMSRKRSRGEWTHATATTTQLGADECDAAKKNANNANAPTTASTVTTATAADVDWDSVAASAPRHKRRRTADPNEDDEWRPDDDDAEMNPEDDEIDPNDLHASSGSDNNSPSQVHRDESVSDPRPRCRYGKRCYRRNPEHRRLFRH
jgi:hypothetical protein